MVLLIIHANSSAHWLSTAGNSSMWEYITKKIFETKWMFVSFLQRLLTRRVWLVLRLDERHLECLWEDASIIHTVSVCLGFVCIPRINRRSWSSPTCETRVNTAQNAKRGCTICWYFLRTFSFLCVFCFVYCFFFLFASSDFMKKEKKCTEVMLM